MRRGGQQKGFVLIMVITLIPLLGMASLVLISNSRQILTNTRRTAVKTQAQFACESGIEWIKKNKNAVVKDQLVVLEIDNESQKITCSVELINHSANQSVFSVIGYAADKRFSYKYPQKIILK